VIPDNACILCITAAAGTELADAYSSSTVRTSSLRKEVYNPQAVIPHAVLLRQAFAHCGKFHVLLTRPPLRLKALVRLACIKHTASVHPEPGSNSP